MNRSINYESEKVLPSEISGLLRKTEVAIHEGNFERDKTVIYLSQLKFEIFKWFADHGTIEEGTE
jgi:hypothetical protein